MFLNKLNIKEKKAFLQLAHYTARIGNDFGNEEKQIIEMYSFEMGIEKEEFNKNKFDLNEILEAFETKQSKKIVLLELMAMIYADNEIDEKEEELVQKICKKFNITRKRAKIYEEWTKAILALYKQGQLFLDV